MARMKKNAMEPSVPFGLGLLVGLGFGIGIHYLYKSQQAVVVEAKLPGVEPPPAPQPKA